MKLDKLVKIAVAALEDVKAHNITVLNVIGATTLFDRMIIASADSTRQTRALANNVQDKVRSGGGAVYGIEGGETGEWVLVDLGDVLVHIMQTSIRAHYNLEELWAGSVSEKVDVITTVASKLKSAARPRKPPTKPPSTAKRTKSKPSE
jgi:ribosome-associated protein